MDSKTMLIAMLIFKILATLFFFYFAVRIIIKFSKDPKITLVHMLLAFMLTALFFQPGLHSIISFLRSVISGHFLSGFISGTGDPVGSGIKPNAVDPNLAWFNGILFILLFMIMSYFIKFIFNYQYESTTEPNAGRAKSNALQNLVVIFLLTLSIYFSISAIIAVPVFNFEPNYDLKLSDQLRAELDTLAQNDTIIQKEYVKFVTDDPAEQDNHVDSVLEDTKIYEDNILEINSIFRDIETLKNRAVNRMKVTDLSDITPKLKLRDKSYLTTWYLLNRTNLLNYMYAQESFIHNFTNELRYETNLDPDTIKVMLKTDLALVKPTITDLKERPSLGSDLGVFTFFTGWLMESESYSLVVIIGLIGFGLLGAAGSTFIREQRTKANPQLLIEDLPGVMIKGFTAAIVVFLGVQGGLAVLTNNDSELNAYALFFVSFVAAVFSDDAWAWAKGKFGKEFKVEENPNPGNNPQT
ncbi:MAG TPA: hypothetical protein VFG10_03020 [Saprospiraceae bacterium]|nr:hypothetical protein [Saprospiraceae bacterium]